MPIYRGTKKVSALGIDSIYVGKKKVYESRVLATATVSGLGSESPSSVTFDVDENIFLGIEEVVFHGNVFIKIPKMYRKVASISSGQITSFIISTKKIDETYFIYPCFLKEDGVTEMDYILIGKYFSGSSSVATSISGTSEAAATPSVGRESCKAVGDGYLMWDWQIMKLWQDLLICKMKKINTNSGAAITLDALGISWSSNGGFWVDGIKGNSAYQLLCSYKPSQYTDSGITDYFLVDYFPKITSTSGQEVKTLVYNSSQPFCNFPSAVTKNTSYNTYYCDCFYSTLTSSTSVYAVKCYFAGSNSSDGAFSFAISTSTTFSSSSYFRLCYRPIND